MTTATITSKGQVTIPKNIRESLHLHTGDKLEFLITSEGDAIIRPITKTVDNIYGKLYRQNRKSISIEQMDLSIKNKMKSSLK